MAAAQLIPIEIPTPPKQSDNQKMVTYKLSVCTAKKIEIENTTNPAIAIRHVQQNVIDLYSKSCLK